MAEGWIKVHRSLLDSPVFHDLTAEQFRVAMACLLMANHEPNKWFYKGKKYECEAGQFITSLPHITEVCGNGASIQKTRTALKHLEELEFLTDKPTGGGRLITIVNWSLYQGCGSKPTGNSTGYQQVINRTSTANKNDKNENNEKNNRYDHIGLPEIKELIKLCIDHGRDQCWLARKFGYEFYGQMSFEEYEKAKQMIGELFNAGE